MSIHLASKSYLILAPYMVFCALPMVVHPEQGWVPNCIEKADEVTTNTSEPSPIYQTTWDSIIMANYIS